MSRTTVPGAVQVLVVADPGATEELSKAIKASLEALSLRVINCTNDYPDHFDPSRRKFHMLAIPAESE
jgi:hypothetical protein